MTEQAPADPLQILPGYVLRRASARAMSDLTDRLSPLGLRPSEASVLIVVLENQTLAQRALGRVLGIASGNLASTVKSLADAGYLERARIDGRAVRLTLTGAGKKVARKAFRIMWEHETTLMARVPEHLHEPFLEAISALAFEDSGQRAAALSPSRLVGERS